MASNNQANVGYDSDAVSGAFGMGMDYFMANDEDRAEIASNAVTLEKDEWETLSDRMVQVYRSRLVGVQDLRNAGLVRNISLATQVDLWQKLSDFTDAEMTMDGETRSEEDSTTYQTEGVPVPITHKDFRISERALRASRQLNNDLRTDDVANATRQVVERLEYTLFQGWTPSFTDSDSDSYTLYGYTSHPDRNSLTAANNSNIGDWSNAGPGETNAGNIRSTVVEMLNTLDDDNRTGGGFWLYIAPQQWREFRSTIDSNGDGNLTVRERITDEFDQEIGDVKRAEYLNDGNAVMVDPSPDVVELAEAEDVQTIEWQSGSGMTNHYKVMAAMAPELKSDSESKSGIAHATGI